MAVLEPDSLCCRGADLVVNSRAYSNKASKVGEGVCRLGRWRRISSAFSSVADVGVDQYGAVGHGDVVHDCQASQRSVVPP